MPAETERQRPGEKRYLRRWRLAEAVQQMIVETQTGERGDLTPEVRAAKIETMRRAERALRRAALAVLAED